MTPPELDDDHVASICSVLVEHEVAFVVIGGVAARLHDTGHATVDIDVRPSRAKENLARLAAALRALGARLRVEGDPQDVAFDPHADLLANVTTMTLMTRQGPLDVCFTPVGFERGTTISCSARSLFISRTSRFPSPHSKTSSHRSALPVDQRTSPRCRRSKRTYIDNNEDDELPHRSGLVPGPPASLRARRSRV